MVKMHAPLPLPPLFEGMGMGSPTILRGSLGQPTVIWVGAYRILGATKIVGNDKIGVSWLAIVVGYSSSVLWSSSYL